MTIKMNLRDRIAQLRHKHLNTEQALFLKQWLRHPLRMGAIAPSSRALSELMGQAVIDRLAAAPEGYVIELGAGTGRFTQFLLEAGIPLKQLIVVEMDSTLCHFLEAKFPGLQVICGDACHLERLIPPHLHGEIISVISGLPLKVISAPKVRQIVESSFRVLSSEGEFLQFTYSLLSPLPAAAWGLQEQRLGNIFLNLPPASVWRFSSELTAKMAL